MAERDKQIQERTVEGERPRSSHAVRRVRHERTPPPQSHERSISDDVDADFRERETLLPNAGISESAFSFKQEDWPQKRETAETGSLADATVPAPPPTADSMAVGADREARTEAPPAGRSSEWSRPTIADIEIPPAPRLPQLDLEPINRESVKVGASYYPRHFEGDSSGVSGLRRAETLRTPPPSPRFSEAPLLTRTPYEDGWAQSAAQGESSTDRSPPSARSSRIYFASHLRVQAEKWLETGSLSLSGCSSPRHSRALQRALLLAMLHEHEWLALPEGLKQRVTHLFCDGWESSAGAAHPLREIDDLAAVLGITCTTATRTQLAYSVAARLPVFVGRRVSSRPPLTRR